MPDATERWIRKIRLGEDSFLELEEVVFAGGRIKGPGRDQLADELAALANAAGGVVLLGVSDAPRAVTGIPLEHLDAVERYVSEIVRDSITPPLVPLVEKLELPDAAGRLRPVLKIEVPRGFAVHQSPGGYLHLADAGVRPVGGVPRRQRRRGARRAALPARRQGRRRAARRPDRVRLPVRGEEPAGRSVQEGVYETFGDELRLTIYAAYAADFGMGGA